MSWRSCLGIAVLAAACNRNAAAPGWTEAPYPTVDATGTRVMLVAGGDDVANFAQEVVDQRRMWRATAVPDDAVSCFWAKPTKRAWAGDRRQYGALAEVVNECAAASPGIVLDAIRAAAASDPEDFYLYITSHGVPSLGGDEHGWVLPPEERAFLDQHALALDATRPRVGDPAGLLTTWHNEPGKREQLVMTPAALRDALLAFAPHTRRVVVLQGCFSGGFLDGPDSLRSVPNTVVLTAASSDRPSFGCGSGTRTTFWGGALSRELDDRLGRRTTPQAIDWFDVHRNVARRVRNLERALGQRPSQPQFFDTATTR